MHEYRCEHLKAQPLRLFLQAPALSFFLILLLLASSPATAQRSDFPSRPIRLLVGFPAGGAGDSLGRIIGERLADNLGQPVVVDNRAGAGGKIAAELLAQSIPDGHTLMLTSAAPIIVAPALGQKLNFDPHTLTPIAKLTDSMVVVLANPSLKLGSVKDLIALAKAKPRSLTYASPGIGTLPHLSGELLKSAAGIDIVHVPYKGTSAIMPAQISGEVMLSLVPLGAAMTQIRSGRLQPLAVTGRSRSAALPDVPTLAESGLRGFNVSLWYGIFAPGKTNQVVVKNINQQITNIINLQQVKDRLLSLALEPSASTPGELAQLVRSEEKLWAKVIKEANIKID